MCLKKNASQSMSTTFYRAEKKNSKVKEKPLKSNIPIPILIQVYLRGMLFNCCIKVPNKVGQS